MFNPPILSKVDGLLGAVNIGNAGGGTNWPGGAYDPETHIAYAPAANAGVGSYSLVPPPPGFSDFVHNDDGASAWRHVASVRQAYG